MDSEYIKGRKSSLQAEFDANAEQINKLQGRQVWLQGAFAELSAAEDTAKAELPQPAKKETK